MVRCRIGFSSCRAGLLPSKDSDPRLKFDAADPPAIDPSPEAKGCPPRSNGYCGSAPILAWAPAISWDSQLSSLHLKKLAAHSLWKTSRIIVDFERQYRYRAAA